MVEGGCGGRGVGGGAAVVIMPCVPGVGTGRGQDRCLGTPIDQRFKTGLVLGLFVKTLCL